MVDWAMSESQLAAAGGARAHAVSRWGIPVKRGLKENTGVHFSNTKPIMIFEKCTKIPSSAKALRVSMDQCLLNLQHFINTFPPPPTASSSPNEWLSAALTVSHRNMTHAMMSNRNETLGSRTDRNETSRTEVLQFKNLRQI